MSNHGIPTEYKSLRFRSRLEATWARFFDAVEWPWKYEPFDYDGYIPDFALLFPGGHILAEVKPCLSLEEMQEFTAPIDRSPWQHEALILGVGPIEVSASFTPAIGLHGNYDYWHPEQSEPRHRVWEPATLHFCGGCEHYSFHSTYGAWWCRWNGEKAGCDHHQFTGDSAEIQRLWHQAQNLVRWAPWAPRVVGSER